MGAFPEHNWRPWRFYSLSTVYWRSRALVGDSVDIKAFIESISTEAPLHIASLEVRNSENTALVALSSRFCF
jgi:hypothetical protein